MRGIEFRLKAFSELIILSFAAYIVRSIEYISIGSYAPIIVALTMGTIIFMGVHFGKTWVRYFIKTWGVLLILFGTLRYLLIGMLYFGNVNEQHILDQFTFLFNLFNILTIILGWYILKNTRKALVFV